ncbi:UNVERIFIED_CONTAM: hypothetical protein GTU68_011159, partial [Idotea baltica]|nr:hypothetical protein [Idotea baltica]
MLTILDQLRLPEESVYIPIPDIATAWEAIKSMKVRGAPAIGIVAGLSVVIELRHKSIRDYSELETFLKESFDYLITSRPTAVNMADMKQRLIFMLTDLKHKSQPQEMKSIVINWLENEFKRDIEINKKMSSYGADKLIELCTDGASDEKKTLRILTHCNTGSLATAGYGTALGVIRQLHERGRLDKAFATETRPYNQGSRLTAFELIYENIPHLLICDNMAAS